MSFFATLDAKDRKLLVGCLATVVVLAFLTAFFARNQNSDDNPLPSSYLTGRHGARAAYDMLAASGYDIHRWEQPLTDLSARADSNTVMVFADPILMTVDDLKAVRQILEAGGRVLVTGAPGGRLAPDANVRPPMAFQAACELTPQGLDPLAGSGTVWMVPEATWGTDRPGDRVEYSCAGSPAVVEYSDGKGKVIWWASASPLENGSISRADNLDLLLSSLGPRDRHHFYWDESLHGETRSPWFYARGPAIVLFETGLIGIGILVLFSFSRRSGPLRPMPQPVRATPVEFLEALGSLYAEAGAAVTAVELAFERFRHKAADFCGTNTAKMSAEELGHAVRRRFEHAPEDLEKDLADCEEAMTEDKLVPKKALALVQALIRHQDALEAAVKRPVHNSQ
jgi:hypothetical protein